MPESTETVQLTRIEGGINLLNDRLATVRDNIKDVRDTVCDHSGRLVALEKDQNLRDGERKGIAHGGKVLWAMIGLLTSAAGAGLLRLFNA